MDRRDFLRGGMLLGCSAAAHPLLSSVTLAGAQGATPLGDNRLVVIILRGAMDGLAAVQPTGDAALAGLRPTLLRPDAIDLDGFFGLHPAMANLMPLWRDGSLGFVHATSTPFRDKRSHFYGQDVLEAGTGTDVPLAAQQEGWLNRLLQAVPGVQSQTAYAVGQGEMQILMGPAPYRDWSPDVSLALSPQAQLLFKHLYKDDKLFNAAAAGALQMAGSSVDEDQAKASGPFGNIDQICDFVADRLLEETRIATFSLNGWDTHQRQAAALDNSLGRLAHTILRLQEGLGPQVWGKTTILAMTEFGRTARENGTAGTDHGTAGAMVMAGGALRGAKVYGAWPGLAEADLYDRRDLMPTSDVRFWAAHAMRGMFGLERSVLESAVFPGLHMGEDPGLLR